MYERITAENPYEVPMRIYPAVHYTMGGLWVDYDLQTTVPGLFAIGEANFSDHGANRLGASALMQGLADGYFVLPSTINDYLARNPHHDEVTTDHPAVQEALAQTEDQLNLLLSIDGDRTPDSFHRELGELMWELCGMARTETGLRKALDRIPQIREEFWRRVKVPGTGEELNQSLEKANRIVDYLELAELMCLDALHRAESCGGHFREESQTPDGEAARRDEEFSYAAAWEFTGTGTAPRPAQGRPGLRVRPPHPAELRMKLTLRVWRQRDAGAEGGMTTYDVDGISPDMSFLEMLDTLNEELILKGDDPVAFDHDCREGICGACSLVINGEAHGPERTTSCQLHMRSFRDGDTIDVEPWRAAAFPVVRDLVVDRSAFDRIIQSGGYITAPTGAAPEAHATPVPKPDARPPPSSTPSASAAARAWRPARTVRRCCSPRPRSTISTCSPRARPNASRGSWTWWPRWTRRASAAAPSPASAPPPAPRASRCSASPG
ncbi:hypothetical protein SRIMM317S_02626 [Streptomyces rimosus subsp. rimosus]